MHEKSVCACKRIQGLCEAVCSLWLINNMHINATSKYTNFGENKNCQHNKTWHILYGFYGIINQKKNCDRITLMSETGSPVGLSVNKL